MKNPRQRRIGTGFEQLEDRRLKAVTAELVDGTLLISGDNASNQVAIYRRDYAYPVSGTFGFVVRWEHVNDLLVSFDGAYRRFAAGDVRQIRADLKGGDDSLAYLGVEPSSSDTSNLDKSVNFSLGDGNDRCRVAFNSIGYSQTSINIIAGGGDDTLDARLVNPYGAGVSVIASMGSGNDTANVQLEGNLDATATFRLLGEEGNDKLFLLAEAPYYSSYSGVRVGSYAVLNAQLSGGLGDDQLGFAYQGELDGRVELQMSGEAGRDQAWCELYLESASTGSLHAKVWDADSDDWFDLRLYNLSSRAKAEVEEIAFYFGSLPQPQKLAPITAITQPSILPPSTYAPSLSASTFVAS